MTERKTFIFTLTWSFFDESREIGEVRDVVRVGRYISLTLQRDEKTGRKKSGHKSFCRQRFRLEFHTKVKIQSWTCLFTKPSLLWY